MLQSFLRLGHNISGQEKIPVIDNVNIELPYFIIKPNPALQNGSNQYIHAAKCFFKFKFVEFR